jgi:hypothetical protein
MLAIGVNRANEKCFDRSAYSAAHGTYRMLGVA